MVRTLPIRVTPLPGEAFDSWLDALAHRNDTTWLDLLAALGLSQQTTDNQRYRNAVLTDAEIADVAAATGVSVDTVSEMTLDRYVGSVLDRDRNGNLVTRAPFGRIRGSRFCPRCLTESGGRWPLRWRLGWSFSCLQHRCLLADGCPDCGGLQRNVGALASEIPQPGRCDHRRRHGSGPRRCPGTLEQAQVHQLPTDHPALAAQRIVFDVIDPGIGQFGLYARHPRPAQEVLTAIGDIVKRALRRNNPQALADHVPADLLTAHHFDSDNGKNSRAGLSALAAAVGIMTAVSILNRDTLDDAAAAAGWLLERTYPRQPLLGARTNTGGTVWAAAQMKAHARSVSPTDQLRYRVASEFPRRPDTDPDTAHRLARRLPTLLWREFSVRLEVTATREPSYMRAPLAAAVMMVGTSLSRFDAEAMIGAGTKHPRTTARVLLMLHTDEHWPDILTALTRIGDYLHTEEVPIDYARRRKLDYSELLTDSQWQRICRETGALHGRRQRLDHARALLFERISGLPIEQGPFERITGPFLARRPGFLRELTPELSDHLTATARRFLDEQGLDGEPVSWHPPLELLNGLDLPGPDPAEVDIATLHRLIRVEKRSVPDCADHLGTTTEVVRYLMEVQPTPTSLLTDGQRRQRGHGYLTARQTLPEPELVRLYLHDRHTIAEIAKSVGARAEHVAQLCHEYGVPIRRAQRGNSHRTQTD